MTSYIKELLLTKVQKGKVLKKCEEARPIGALLAGTPNNAGII